MDRYVTGAMIKRLREAQNLTQLQLAERLCVSDKAVSKWETGRGYPDITLIEPLAAALGVSVIELLSGEDVQNTNRSFNMQKLKLLVCPVCGNVIVSAGAAVVSCCGITLPPLEAEPEDAEHRMTVEKIEDEYYVSIPHDMEKAHHISFIAAVYPDGIELKKLYPEGGADARFKRRCARFFLFCCNRHGLFRAAVPK